MATDPSRRPADDLSPEGIARRTFSTSFRGFDQLEVRGFLNAVAGQVSGLVDRHEHLRQELADTRARLAAVEQGDVHRLTTLLGEETARVLEAARDAAAHIRAKAEESVALMLQEASDEASRIRAEADTVLARRTEEADAEAARIRAAAEEIRAAAAAAADAEVEAARQRGREMVGEAQLVRERVLRDLARRRKLARQQLEQLRAGRDRLLAAYHVVRRTLDEVTQELSVAMTEARAAAEAAGRRAADGDEPTAEELEAELAVLGAPAPELAAMPAPAMPADAGSADAVPRSAEPPFAEREPEPERERERDERPVLRFGDGIEPPAATVLPPVAGPPPLAPTGRRRFRRRPEPEPGEETAGWKAAPGGPHYEGVRVIADEPPEGGPGVRIVADRAADAVAGEPGTPAEPVPTEPGPTPPPEPGPGPDEPVPSTAARVGSDQALEPAPQPDEPAPGGPPAVEPLPDEPPTEPLPQEPPTEPLPGPPAGPGPEPPDEPPPAPVADRPTTPVEELFARLRASRAEAVARAEAVLQQEPDPERAPEPEPEPESQAESTAEGDEPPPSPSAQVLGRRDEAVAGPERALARKLKRLLSDEQNGVLDTLRRHRGPAALDELVGPPDEHRRRVLAMVSPDLAAAASAGAASAGGEGVQPSVEPVAADLAAALVDPLRERVDRVVRESAGDEDAVAERLRACYREWRTQRVPDLVRHAAVAAYAAGVVAAVPSGTPMCWVVDTGGAPCPDAEDNALAGAVPSGEPFPTGHTAPPAHPGCRCLAVPEAALHPS